MSAQRSSAPVRFARLAATAGIVILAAFIVIRLSGRREAEAPAPAGPAPGDGVVDLTERVHHQEYRSGRQVADIRGDSFFRDPEGRNHLQGSVEVLNLGPAGETASRLTADEVVYDPGSLRFTVTGNVRVKAGGIVLEGPSFEYDKDKGLFMTRRGGRFSAKTMQGNAPEVEYTEGTDEIRLGGGFLAEMAGPDRGGQALAVSGDSLIYARRARRGRVDGRAVLRSGGQLGAAETIAFIASGDETALESAVLEGGARIAFKGDAPGDPAGGIGADRIALTFARAPGSIETIEAGGDVTASLRVAPGLETDFEAPAAGVKLGRAGELLGWSASGGVVVSYASEGGRGHRLQGESAGFEASPGVLLIRGGTDRAVAESAEARVEADVISVDPGAGTLEAAGGVRCRLRGEDGLGPAMDFFSLTDDVNVTSDRAFFRDEGRAVSFKGTVRAWQGERTLRADELEYLRGAGEMHGRGGVEAVLGQAAHSEAGNTMVQLCGEDMDYRSAARTLTLTGKASVRLPRARLTAGAVSAVIGSDGGAVESLAAGPGVTVSKGPYEGRAEAASYQAATRRITLTGRPVLTDGKGGAARGAKLTFDLADDKILIENEGAGRATTVVRS